MLPIVTVLSWFLVLGVSIAPLVSSQCLTHDDNIGRAGPINLAGMQKFHLDLFQELVPSGLKENFVFSPYSIWNTLVLAYFGSNGSTERQFRRVLRVEDKVTTLKQWRSLEYLYAMRPETTINNTFVVANRVFFDDTVYLRFCMLNILHNEIERLDFSNSPKAAQEINDFVSKTTQGGIKDLVSASDVANARMVLANAAFFKGTWASTFDARDTRSSPFYNFDSTTGEVQMMMQFGSFKYGYSDSLKAEIIELPYTGKALSMFIFLPYMATAANFDAMIHGMTPEKLEKNFKKMYRTTMRINIPKFSIESHVGIQLMEALRKMGLKDAFIRDRADFSGFTLFESISLDKSVHKAYIEVNEEGTEAGAATAFITTKLGGTASFECNRPFVYMIRDNDTKNLVFIGTYKSAASRQKKRPMYPSFEDQLTKG